MSDFRKLVDGGEDGISWFMKTEQDGSQTLKATQSDDALRRILDVNKAFQNSGHDGYTESREMQHVGFIPTMIIEMWKEKYGIDALNPHHRDGVVKLLNSSEWSAIRTGGGRLK